MKGVLKDENLMDFAEGLGAFGVILGASTSFRIAIKDLEHRYVKVNQVWLNTFGYKNEDQVLGKTAHSIFPLWRAERYIREEKMVMTEGRCYDYEEYLLDHVGGTERWHTLKGPWVENGQTKGFVNLGVRLGTSLDLEKRGDNIPELVQVLASRACESISLEDLARDLGISKRTLERKFSKIMDETPSHFRTRCRIAAAKRFMKQGENLIDIALKCGFADQSHFSRTFMKIEGFRPTDYVKRLAD